MNIRPVINALDEFCLHCPHVVPVCDRCMVLAFHEWLYAQKEREDKGDVEELLSQSINDLDYALDAMN